MLATLVLAAAQALAPAAEATVALGRGAALVADGAVARLETAQPPAVYDPAARAVANWRGETLRNLAPAPLAALAWFGAEARTVTRCVRLNNYWCVKRAGWAGEVGADDEGHTAFASAEAGADAAAGLLRRYYLDFGRRSALDIVRRWAPAECGGGLPAISRVIPAAPAMPLVLRGSAAPASPAARPAPSAGALPLTTRGLGRTLRARYLAARKPRRPAARQARPGGPVPVMRGSAAGVAPRLPAIAAGLPEAPALAPLALAASLPAAAALAVPRSCADEDRRQRNYAERIVQGLGVGPADDLRLFEPDGRPRPNLAPVLAAMSGFELGALRAGAGLVAGAVARLEAGAGR